MLAIPVIAVVGVACAILGVWDFSPQVIWTVGLVGGLLSFFAFAASEF